MSKERQHGVGLRSLASGITLSGFKSQRVHFLAIWPQAGHSQRAARREGAEGEKPCAMTVGPRGACTAPQSSTQCLAAVLTNPQNQVSKPYQNVPHHWRQWALLSRASCCSLFLGFLSLRIKTTPPQGPCSRAPPNVPIRSSLQVPSAFPALATSAILPVSPGTLPTAEGHLHMVFPLPRIFFSHKINDYSSFYLHSLICFLESLS